MGMKQHPAYNAAHGLGEKSILDRLIAERDRYIADNGIRVVEQEHENFLFTPDGEDEMEFAVKVQTVADTNVALLLRKHRDYGPSNIANSPAGPLNGLRVRMHDKLARINHLIDTGAEPENESLYDSFVDLANYAIIAQLVIRGEWPRA